MTKREVATYVADLTGPQECEVWVGPVHELRARLRDEARVGRVKPAGYLADRPGLPRGWSAMQVTLTPRELERLRRGPAPRRWPWIAAGVTAGLAALAGAGYALFVALAGLVAEAAGAGTIGFLLIVGGLVLLASGRSTTLVEVLVKVRR